MKLTLKKISLPKCISHAGGEIKGLKYTNSLEGMQK